ncbi:MAG: hypothetical protein QM572_00100 [Nocardioides sp.]|uniref:hypothetical protein n=1 Tax=Nocardioides sp. TaxID=35761 RepID=UPI0039E2AAFF
MNGQPLEAIDVARLVREHFGPRVSHLSLRDGSVVFVLYDAFSVAANPDGYGTGGHWGFGIYLPNHMTLIELFGEKLTIKTTREQIVAALTLIDRYARLRLGSEYLDVFELSHPAPE